MIRVFRGIGSVLTLMSLPGVLLACSGTSSAAGGSTPPSAAPPGQVARAYLRAALTGNCKLTAELTLPKSTWNWCKDPKLLGFRSVQSPYSVTAPQTGRSGECVAFEIYTHGSSDGSMPVGWQPWSLCFAQTGAGWRVYGQGQG
jgi:hypothetical protein